MDMALFLSADFHQGNEIFNVHSRGKQCAFMALSALLTARNIPLSSWSKVTFNNVLIQGDKLYLQALNTGFIVLDQGTDFLSVEHLPKAISVSSLCTNMSNDFSYEICQPMISLPHSSVQENIVTSPNGDLPTVVEPFGVQNNITKVASEAENINTDPPIVVQLIDAQNINTDSPIVVKPIEAQNINTDSPIVVKPIEAQNINIDSPIAVKAKSVNQICHINYEKELQGLVITDQEIESCYYDIHTALLNTFANDCSAILILEGYMMALVKQTDNFYLFDSHARDLSGIPDPSGTAVVMAFTNIIELEQYLYCLSTKLHANLFEIVPVQLNMCKNLNQETKCVKDREYQRIKRSVETECDRQTRLEKANNYNKRKRSEATDGQKQIDLKKIESLKKTSAQ